MRVLPMEGLKILFLFSTLLSIIVVSDAVDTITKSQFIADGKTIVSASESFEMGFFSPGNSRNRYVGIWYKKIAIGTVVWVANREVPLTDMSGVLKIVDPGILVLHGGANNIIWSTNPSRSAQNPVVQLLDSGNLVVKDANNDNPDHILWQSFDHPCDTLLPGMKLGKNFVTRTERDLSSWKSEDDPSRGSFTFRFDPQGYPQLVLSSGLSERFRTGPWNGLRFSGTPNLKLNSLFTFELVFTEEEAYYAYQLLNSSIFSRFVMSQDGVIQALIWINRIQEWVIYLTIHVDNCDTYNLCGPHGSCNIENSPPCSCLSKFVPKYIKALENGDWSNGCVRRTPLDCHNGDGFLKYSGYKLPETQHSWFNTSMTLGECKTVCLKNCSCMAYTNLDIREGGSGCLLWFGDLTDMREFTTNGQDIYIRMASSELGIKDLTDQQVAFNGKQKERVNGKKKIVIVTFALLIGLLLLGLGVTIYLRRKRTKNSWPHREGNLIRNSVQGYTDKSQKEDLDLPLFDLPTIANSTSNFSIDNKLGQGGFGPVYKGKLEGGQEIAVKRLSKNSSQGLDEFKNEVICIAKLQHRNLVKLLGYCIQGEEKMLIYEYMPNKSLDYFIFDRTQSALLDWPKRFHIINGIARGLLYLHQDSRLRIIHRDLKVSNILLDINMNPKISDFGLARSFRGEETEANTNRVVGTYGYMSPEYAADGLFSVKSDVFSFGVLVLEIVSGKRNRGFYHADHHLNLLGHAWGLFMEGRSLELIDEPLRDSCYPSEVLRAIHVGLLCVQQCPEDRPSMSSVVLMLGSEGALPHQPKQPGFFSERNLHEAGCSPAGKDATPSPNELTITLSAR